MNKIDDVIKDLRKKRHDIQIKRAGYGVQLAWGVASSSEEKEHLNSLIKSCHEQLKQIDEEIKNLESEKEKESLSSVWSIRGIPDKERAYATEQAQKEGVTIANWVAKAIQNQAELDLKGDSGKATLKMLSTSRLREIISLIGELKALGCEPPKEIMTKLYEHINREV